MKDVLEIFKQGRRTLLRCCLQIYTHFQRANDHQGYYLLNKIFISDYLIWLQKVSSASIENFRTNHLNKAVDAMFGNSSESGKLSLGSTFGNLIVNLDKKARATLEEDSEVDSDDDSGDDSDA